MCFRVFGRGAWLESDAVRVALLFIDGVGIGAVRKLEFVERLLRWGTPLQRNSGQLQKP